MQYIMKFTIQRTCSPFRSNLATDWNCPLFQRWRKGACSESTTKSYQYRYQTHCRHIIQHPLYSKHDSLIEGTCWLQLRALQSAWAPAQHSFVSCWSVLLLGGHYGWSRTRGVDDFAGKDFSAAVGVGGGEAAVRVSRAVRRRRSF
jgi:hypothetical protein